eukprot:76419-Chlamydomonas_euryale.AAC.2
MQLAWVPDGALVAAAAGCSQPMKRALCRAVQSQQPALRGAVRQARKPPRHVCHAPQAQPRQVWLHTFKQRRHKRGVGAAHASERVQYAGGAFDAVRRRKTRARTQPWQKPQHQLLRRVPPAAGRR